MFESSSTIIPGHRYRNATAAIDWLCKVFGFERHAVYEGKDDEFSRSFKSPRELGGIETRTVYIVVPDADAAHARALAAGAEVIRPLLETPYGSREFGVKDPEGHTWIAGTYDPWDVS